MASLIAVLVAAMFVAANFDLRSNVQHAPDQLPKAESVRIWRATAEKFETELEGEIKAAGEASNIAVSPRPSRQAGKKSAGPSNVFPTGGNATLSLMSIDFTLTEPRIGGAASKPELEGALTVKKPIFAGDRLIGNLDITIAREGELLLDAQEVRAMLGQGVTGDRKSSTPLPGQELVSFASLREIGIDLRYSPHEDVIRLNP